MESVLMPFALLSQGLQNLGSNLVDNKLSRSCEQFMGLDLVGGGGKKEEEDLTEERADTRKVVLEDRLLRVAKSPACQSLVLNI